MIDVQKCMNLGHVPTTYQYGLHSDESLPVLPVLPIKSRWDWKDTYAVQ